MKIYISYFYKVRFFKENMFGVSTAKWDPRWFHNFNGENFRYIDKNGVLNGLRAPILVLPDELAGEIDCCKPCPHEPPHCRFMTAYRKYLNSLDFDDIYNRLDDLGHRAAAVLAVDDPIVILLVHEPTSCKCAERPVLQQWFAEHGVELKEWESEYIKEMEK